MDSATKSSKSMEVLANLRANIEGYVRSELIEGEFYEVYLDNAVPDGMSQYTFRSCLAELAKRGFYQVVDGYAWGRVKFA